MAGVASSVLSTFRSVGNAVEIEDKYDAPDDAEIQGLDEIDGVAAVSHDEMTLEATYFDTADLALLRVGITVRRRRGGPDEGWRLKVPVDDGRHEVRLPLSRSVLTVPKPFRDTLRTLVGAAPLEPVATLTTRRTLHRLHDARGRVLPKWPTTASWTRSLGAGASGRWSSSMPPRTS